MTCTIVSMGEELNLVSKNDHEAPYPEIKARLHEKIWELYCKGYDRFWVNCEYGVPMWCAEVIIALSLYNDIELNIAMPYEEQSTNWVEDHRERFFAAHAEADHVEIISPYCTEDCYERADEYMIDNSDLLLVVGRKRIGTHCLKYAANSSVGVEFFEIKKVP